MGDGFYELGAILERELQPGPSPVDHFRAKVVAVTSVTGHRGDLRRFAGFCEDLERHGQR
jgi:hypothetical protein